MVKSAMVESPLDGAIALAIAGVVLLPDRRPRLCCRRVGEGFARDRWVTGTLVDIDDAADLAFELPSGRVDYLRFDLPAIAGCYRMGPVVIDGSEAEDLSRRVTLVHGRRLQDPDSAAEVRLAEWSSAPWFEMDVRGLLGTGGKAEPVAVRVKVRKEHFAGETERQLRATAAEIAGHVESQAEAVRGTIVEIAASASLAQQSRYRNLECSMADAVQAMATLSLQTEDVKQELVTLRQQVDALRGQLDFLVNYEINRSLVRRALRKVKRAFWK